VGEAGKLCRLGLRLQLRPSEIDGVLDRQRLGVGAPHRRRESLHGLRRLQNGFGRCVFLALAVLLGRLADEVDLSRASGA